VCFGFSIHIYCVVGTSTSIWPALVHLVTWHCHVVLVVLGHSMVGWSTRVRRLGLSVLVVVAASDMGPRCHWREGGVRRSLLLVPFMGGVLSWSHHHLVTWCCPAVVVAWSSSVVVVVVVSHHCREVFTLPGLIHMESNSIPHGFHWIPYGIWAYPPWIPWNKSICIPWNKSIWILLKFHMENTIIFVVKNSVKYEN